METTNFEKKGFWYFIYRMSYKNELPPDTCTYKRGIIIATLTMLLLWPLTLMRLVYSAFIKIPYIQDKLDLERIHGLVGYLPPLLAIALPMVFGTVYFGDDSTQTATWLLYLVGVGLAIGVIATAILGAYIVIVIDEYIKERKEIKRDKLRMQKNNPELQLPKTAFENLYESWKEKLCKKIEWKDN